LRIPAVIKVVSIVVVDVNVIGGIPAFGPVFRPRIKQQERIAAVLETRIPHIHHWARAQAKEVPAAKRDNETVLRDVVAAVASALLPCAMVG
jgi:hypothetical protein